MHCDNEVTVGETAIQSREVRAGQRLQEHTNTAHRQAPCAGKRLSVGAHCRLRITVIKEGTS